MKTNGVMRRLCFLLLAGLASIAALADTPAKKQSLQPASEGSFSIAVIPDTQAYISKKTNRLSKSTEEAVTNRIFDDHISWILDNLQDQRIVFVSHVGDIVDKYCDNQWAVARACMDRLHGKVPYGISVGNHDMVSTGDSKLFQKYFGQERFKDFQWYGGCFGGDPKRPGHSGNNANSFQLFSAEGYDFVILHLECNAPDNVLKWADDILDKYSDRIAIVTTHMYLGPLKKPRTEQGWYDDPKGVMRWKKTHKGRGNTPQQMWEKCFQNHPNLRLIFCGDQRRSQAMHLQQTGKHGNVVHSLLSDYSSGPLRLCRFTPAKNELQVITLDPAKGTLVESTNIVPDGKEHQFTLPMNLRSQANRREVQIMQ